MLSTAAIIFAQISVTGNKSLLEKSTWLHVRKECTNEKRNKTSLFVCCHAVQHKIQELPLRLFKAGDPGVVEAGTICLLKGHVCQKHETSATVVTSSGQITHPKVSHPWFH